MKVFIVRHGQAENGGVYDASRSLTEVGHQQAKKAGLWLVDQLSGVNKPVKILSSPYLRAKQTAHHLAQSLNLDVELAPALQPDRQSHEMLSELLEQGCDQHIILVTHLPLVGRLASLLIDGQEFDQPWSLAEVWHLKGDIAASGCMENKAVWYPALDGD